MKLTVIMQIFDEGGTAVDATLSVALCEIAQTGGKYISYAGIMDLLYYESKDPNTMTF